MKLSTLKQLIKQYDTEKAFYRNIKDLDVIILLKQFIQSKENDRDFSLTDQEVSYFEFFEFANQANTAFSEEYLNSDSKSAHLFKEWREASEAEIINETISAIQLQFKFVPMTLEEASIPKTFVSSFNFFEAKESFKAWSKVLPEKNEEVLFRRFWQEPDSLREHCLNYMAKEIIKNERDNLIHKYEKLPKELKDALDKKLTEAKEIMDQDINFEFKKTIFSSLNSH